MTRHADTPPSRRRTRSQQPLHGNTGSGWANSAFLRQADEPRNRSGHAEPTRPNARRKAPRRWQETGFDTPRNRASRTSGTVRRKAGRPLACPAGNRPPSPARRTPSPAKLIAFIGVLLALCLAIGLGSSFFASSSTPERDPYQSPFDWSNLQWDGDRLSYVQDGSVVSRIGVDVSDHQGYIDWQQVAADGIDFAMIRIGNRGYTEGGLAIDEYFSYNIDSSQAAGLNAGVYFFSQAITPDEAREEAEYVLELLAGRELQMPVAFDHETLSDPAARGNSVSGKDLTACMNAFCETIEAAGYQTMVYGNRTDLSRFAYVDGSARAAAQLASELGGRAVWFAEYDETTPTGPFDFRMWQYTNNGQVAGIDTAVDLNILLPEPPQRQDTK